MRKQLAAILAAAAVLSGCGAEETPPVEKEPSSQEVMLYSSMQEKQIQAIKEGFEAKYPDLTLNYQFGGTGKMLTKLDTEVQFGDIKADLIWTGNPASYLRLKENHMLNPYISPEAEQIDPLFKDDEDYFVGARIFSVVIGYNTELVSAEEAPRTWEDLLDPKWKGRMILADPYSAGSASYLMSAFMQNPDYGEEYFQKLRANGCMLETGTTAAHKQVAEGHYAICIGLDYVVANFVDEGCPMAMQYPEKDGISIYCPIGLVAGGPNEANAKLLYDYILSEEGQKLLVENHLISIREDVPVPGLSAMERMEHGMDIDVEDICRSEDRYLKDFDQIFFSEPET